MGFVINMSEYCTNKNWLQEADSDNESFWRSEMAKMYKKVWDDDDLDEEEVEGKTDAEKQAILDAWRVNIPKIPVDEPETETKSKPADSITAQFQHAKDLQDKGHSEVEISKEMGKPLDWVKGSLLIITKLPAKVHDAIDRKLFSRTTALQLLLVTAERLDIVVDAAIAMAEKDGKI
jgi:hypothetical protein